MGVFNRLTSGGSRTNFKGLFFVTLLLDGSTNQGACETGRLVRGFLGMPLCGFKHNWRWLSSVILQTLLMHPT